jgi:DNA repair exonuclease SbcCD nuclease subunit
MSSRKTPKRAIRLLHTSDVHLHSPESCAGLDAVVDAANHLGVDLFLSAGDLFDSTRVSQETIERALESLGRLTMPGVILPGNHDALDQSSVYHRMDLKRLAPRVRLLTNVQGEELVIPDLDVAIWGRAMEEHTPRFRPLEGAPSRNGVGWYVGMAHGYHFATGENPDRSSPIFPEEIADTGYDYWALGHVHVFRDVSAGPVTAFYSGSPDDHAISPRPGHVALVEMDPNTGVQVRRLLLQTYHDQAERPGL